jgi:hypothetical protein
MLGLERRHEPVKFSLVPGDQLADGLELEV